MRICIVTPSKEAESVTKLCKELGWSKEDALSAINQLKTACKEVMVLKQNWCEKAPFRFPIALNLVLEFPRERGIECWPSLFDGDQLAVYEDSCAHDFHAALINNILNLTGCGGGVSMDCGGDPLNTTPNDDVSWEVYSVDSDT